jgi:HYR domain
MLVETPRQRMKEQRIRLNPDPLFVFLKKPLEPEAALFNARTISSPRLASPPPPSGATTIYDSIPVPLPPNVPSLGFQANQTSEFGDLIQFVGSAGPASTPARKLTQVTVVMSDHALASDYFPGFPTSTASTWNWDIRLNLYNVVTDVNMNPAPGALIDRRTPTFVIPWRPEADPACGSDPRGPWKAGDGICYSGLAFLIIFDFTGVIVPDQIIYGVTFNTLDHGYMPTHSMVAEPYISLNLGLAQVPPSVGSNPFPDTAYWNTTTAGNYADNGAGGTGTFRRDTNWTPFSASAKFDATACTITCPGNIVANTPNVNATCATVSYPAPTTSADCSTGIVCTPASGICFPVGTTTVTCTVQDASMNTATCSFSVTVTNVCLQDDSNPGNVFSGNAATGAYTFCCGGTTFTGVAQVTRHGNILTFTDNAGGRRVLATIDGGVFKGTASLQLPPGTTKCTITDRDTRNNTCVCH